MPAVSLDQLLQQWSERKSQLGKKERVLSERGKLITKVWNAVVVYNFFDKLKINYNYLH